MDPEGAGELVFQRTTIGRVTTLLLPLALTAGVFLVLRLAGGGTILTLAGAALVTCRLWWTAFTAVASQPNALLTEGVRLRTRPSSRSTAVVPWSGIVSLGLAPVGPRRLPFLEVIASDAMTYPGPCGDGRHFLAVPPSVTPEALRDAVERLSDGRLTVGDEPHRRKLVV